MAATQPVSQHPETARKTLPAQRRPLTPTAGTVSARLSAGHRHSGRLAGGGGGRGTRPAAFPTVPSALSPRRAWPLPRPFVPPAGGAQWYAAHLPYPSRWGGAVVFLESDLHHLLASGIPWGSRRRPVTRLSPWTRTHLPAALGVGHYCCPRPPARARRATWVQRRARSCSACDRVRWLHSSRAGEPTRGPTPNARVP